MKKVHIVSIVMLSFIICTGLFAQHLFADVEWTTKKQLNLKSRPLDTVTSADGQMLFILSPGEIVVYSIAQDKILNRIPVGKAFDRITLSPRDNSLIMTSSSQKTLEIIQLEFIHNIDISGHPFKGNKRAPVTIAVFSDYQ